MACLALWAAPLIWLAMTGQDFLLDLALFFSKPAVVTSGGPHPGLCSYDPGQGFRIPDGYARHK